MAKRLMLGNYVTPITTSGEIKAAKSILLSAGVSRYGRYQQFSSRKLLPTIVCYYR